MWRMRRLPARAPVPPGSYGFREYSTEAASHLVHCLNTGALHNESLLASKSYPFAILLIEQTAPDLENEGEYSL